MLDFITTIFHFLLGLVLLGGTGILAVLTIFFLVITIGKIISIVTQKDNWASNFLDHLF